MNNPKEGAVSCNMKDSGSMKQLFMIMHPTTCHVAAGRGCARGVHVDTHVAEEITLNETCSNNNGNDNVITFSTYPQKLRLNQLSYTSTGPLNG